MNPKKHKEFIKPTADELGLSEVLVSDLTSFYWSSVRKHISSLEHHRISVINLGTFKAQWKKIPKMIEKHQNIYNSLTEKETSFENHGAIKNMEENLEKLRKMKEVMIEEHARRKKVKQKRKEYVTNKDLERKGEDSGRD